MNKKVIISALIIMIACICFEINKAESMVFIKNLLEAGYITKGSVIFVIISISCYIYFTPEIKNDETMLFRCNGVWILEIFLNISTYSAITTTSINLIKAIYIQRFYGIKYFTEFDELDIYIMAGVGFMLLWYSLFKCWKMLCDAVNYSQAKEPQRV
ncbi:hypothetical protein RC90_02100 [Pectobacterium brasiliense]|uniref:hypothetical protein n=1 Tax=Pectobacterium brasiliense TaxID=180957 RepID=UPI00057E8009|nr:hypothetical protein [Pectobacterium brasiliense]ARA76692.1 hypothetical protein B5S52_12695 [Pectobacterium brasiliense]KHT01782.1 hypothetical protein RC90_02100 [Pectobacterium brasiliense]